MEYHTGLIQHNCYLIGQHFKTQLLIVIESLTEVMAVSAARKEKILNTQNPARVKEINVYITPPPPPGEGCKGATFGAGGGPEKIK